jgi:predicted MFS family arabinose efflux permease
LWFLQFCALLFGFLEVLVKRLLPLLALIGALLGFSFAQDTPVTVGGFTPSPTDWALISGGVGLLVSPLTALIKRWGKTDGVQTTLVNLALSTLATSALGYSQGAYGPGWPGVGQAALNAGLAFLVSWGQHAARKQATESAQKGLQ